MSTRAAIHYAVCAQLAADGLPEIELRGTLGASLGAPQAGGEVQALLGGTFNRGANYDEAQARRFLAMVSLRLRDDNPSLIFKWSELRDNLLTDTLWMIENRIAANTAFAPEAAEKAADKAKGP